MKTLFVVLTFFSKNKCFFIFQVRVPFKVDHPSALSRIDTVYKCSIVQGIVPPMASVKVPVSDTVDILFWTYFQTCEQLYSLLPNMLNVITII